LRIGEMERDGVCAHGMSYFLNESFMVRGDEYYMAVCNKTGTISVYNESKNLFLSPYADGPIHFYTNPDGSQSIKNLSRFGRTFSILRVPYSLKLLIQELQVMNIQMRIITDENVDQLLSMSYSKNIQNLLHTNEPTESILKNVAQNINLEIRQSRTTTTKYDVNYGMNDFSYAPENKEMPPQDRDSPEYVVPSTPSDYETPSNEFEPWPVQYAPDMPAEAPQKFTRPDTPYYLPTTPPGTPPGTPPIQGEQEEVTYPYTPIVQEFGKTSEQSILEVEPITDETNTGTNDTTNTNTNDTTDTDNTGKNETKKIIINKNE